MGDWYVRGLFRYFCDGELYTEGCMLQLRARGKGEALVNALREARSLIRKRYEKESRIPRLRRFEWVSVQAERVYMGSEQKHVGAPLCPCCGEPMVRVK